MSEKPINYCQEFYTTKFKGKDMKDAYMRACKWYATNVLSKDELQNVQVVFEKSWQSPTVTLHLYVSLMEDAARQEHCNICREFSKSFLCMERSNCNDCKLNGYFNRVDGKIQVKCSYYREIIDRNWE